MKKLFSVSISVLLIISQLIFSVQAQTTTQEINQPNINLPVELVEEFPLDQSVSDSQDAVLSGSSATLYSSSLLLGQGTQESPFLITDKVDLAYFRDRINEGLDAYAYFKLTTDIDLGGAEWTPVGFYSERTKYANCFKGHFDGDGHTIKNFKISNAYNRYIGFFGFTFGATVQNLSLSDFSIDVSYDGYLYVGSLIGRCISESEGVVSTIKNCSAMGRINATSKGYQAYVGGLCGYVISDAKSSTIIENCISNVEVSASLVTTSTEVLNVYSGGFVGYIGCTGSSTITISKCASTKNVTSFNETSGAVSAFSGGFAGYAGTGKGAADDYASISIAQCYSSSKVRTLSLYSSYCGGFLGSYFLFGGDFNITNCYASGNVGGITLSSVENNNYTCVGGFVGYAQAYSNNDSSLSLCYALGNVADEGSQYSYFGRFAGYALNSSINNCYGFESQTIFGHETFDSVPVVLTHTAYSMPESYVGFDFDNYWEINPESNFLYPQLKGLAHVGQTEYYNITFMNGQDVFYSLPLISYANKITPPVSQPVKPEDENFRYKFKGWSLTPNGPLFNFTSTPVFEDATLYAIFSSSDLSSWSGSVAPSFTYGTGTQDDPYLIYTPEELALVAFEVNRGNASFTRACYSLKNDIYLGENEWAPIGTTVFPFRGKFFGNGYSISSFEIKTGDYAGLFGQVSNAVIDGLSVSDFVIDISHNNKATEYMNVGVIAASLSNPNSSAQSSITRCAVFDGTINVTSESSYVCAAGIVGNVDASNGSIFINNCSSDVDITSMSEAKSVYLGGISAKMSMKATSKALIENCYSLGEIYGHAKDSCFAGGLSGYITSTGSWIETSSEATLSSDSADVMILDSFSTGNVTSIGSVTVYAGPITGFANAYATIKNCHCPASQIITSTNNSALPATKNKLGTKTSIENFRMQTYVSSEIGFDFTETWKYLRTIPYPVLKIVYDEKPKFSIVGLQDLFDTVTADIRVVAPSQNFTVMMSVYDSHGKLISLSSTKFLNSAGSLKEFSLSSTSGKYAHKVRISVIDNQTFAPLFKPATREI